MSTGRVWTSRNGSGSSWNSKRFEAPVGSSAGARKWTEPNWSSSDRKPCKFAATCRDKNNDHRWKYSHPGDYDWHDKPNGSDAECASSPSGRPVATGAAKKYSPTDPLAESRQVVALCGDAKARLVAARAKIPTAPLEAVTKAVRRKNPDLDSRLLESGLEEWMLMDFQTILEHDRWDGEKAGREWLRDWVDEEGLAVELCQAEAKAHEKLWCCACSRSFVDEWTLDGHKESKEHCKKVKNWFWRYGREPPDVNSIPARVPPCPQRPPPLLPSKKTGGSEATTVVVATEKLDGPTLESGKLDSKAESSKPTSSKKKQSRNPSAAEVFANALAAAELPAAVAKQNLLEYRNSLSESERQAILKNIKNSANEVLQRANDIAGIEDLVPAFPDHVMRWLREVNDKTWLYGEPTFSWLSGFYWHPESTWMPFRGEEHSAMYCHLCFVECYDDDGWRVHVAGRRHAESMQRWVEVNGATPIATCCDCCPGSWQQSAQKASPGPTIDIEVRREPCELPTPGSNDAEVAAEHDPSQPKGFLAIAGPQPGSGGFISALENGTSKCPIPPRPVDTPYVAFVLNVSPSESNGRRRGKQSGWNETRWHGIAKVRVTSTRLRIGSKETGKKSCWGIDLERPSENETDGLWRSLAIPLTSGSGPLTEGSKHEFHVVIGKDGSDTTEHLDGWFSVVVPANGSVVVMSADIAQSDNGWTQTKMRNIHISKTVPILEFAGAGQINALGGVPELRGTQRAYQLATEDVMLSFLLHIPKSEAPAPLLIFFHGDLTREIAQCPKPGLAEFCDQYGPAMLCSTPKKEGHSARKFVVVTPTSPAEYWWFRHPALHDSTSYVTSVEQWFRRLAAWVADDLQICHRTCAATGHGIRLAGQSMGGYAALELARAIPEQVSAIGVGAPCFDAFRLDWLAERLHNVPLWVMIGRQDTMCAYEEVASLILKMRDRGALLARLSSARIKGHNEACVLLEKEWLYEWFLRPLQRYGCDSKSIENSPE